MKEKFKSKIFLLSSPKPPKAKSPKPSPSAGTAASPTAATSVTHYNCTHHNKKAADFVPIPAFSFDVLAKIDSI